jgi:uncharacterized protein DUF5672
MKRKKRLAIVTPQHRFPLKPDEETSLRHLRAHLGGFDRYLVCPESSSPELNDFTLIRVPDANLASEWAYNKMLLTRQFYEWFSDYEFILVYQLDCLVFSSEILSWCDREWDYIGAPWFHAYGEDPDGGFLGVGNGGFSLRKVQSHLDVFSSRALAYEPVALGWRNWQSYRASFVREVACRLKTMLHRCGYQNTVRTYLDEICQNPAVHEDGFWSWQAQRFKSDFAIPSPEEALQFSFECAPRACLELNGGRLPLGCHAWARYDRLFWEPLLLTKDSEQLLERTA